MPTIRRTILFTLVALTIASAMASCDDGRRTSGSSFSPASEKHFVKVENGMMITALDAGRERFIIHDRTAEMRETYSAPSNAGRTRKPSLAPRKTDESASADSAKADAGAGGAAGVLAGGPEQSEPAVESRWESAIRGGSAGEAPEPVAPAPAGAPAGGGFDAPEGDGPAWSILLRSVTAEEHQQLARQAATAIQQTVPQLRGGLWVNTTPKGSMILYGRFQSIDDPNAQEHLRAVKEVKVGDKQPFQKAHFALVDLARKTEQIHPHDLRMLRRKHPDVDPLYTLDVALWVAGEESGSTWPECRQAAQAYAAQLRSQGYEAYFHLDSVRRMASVLVGKFDESIINSKSGLYAAEAKRLMERFPVRFVNGEELLVAVEDGEEGDMAPQKPQIVEVPEHIN